MFKRRLQISFFGRLSIPVLGTETQNESGSPSEHTNNGCGHHYEVRHLMSFAHAHFVQSRSRRVSSHAFVS